MALGGIKFEVDVQEGNFKILQGFSLVCMLYSFGEMCFFNCVKNCIGLPKKQRNFKN
jgi:hypothetical protein